MQYQDDKVKAIFNKFLDTITGIAAEVDKRNQDPRHLARIPVAGGLEYTMLRPTSDTAGVTFRGVPYIISN